MKKLHLQLMALMLGTAFALNAQEDKTDLILNPSFEYNVDAMAEGWEYDGVDGYAWTTINTDGDETKDGDNICGLWNATFGDAMISQTITGLDNGVYTVTADMMCARNAASLRLTTQRIFANNNSVLYGVEADSNYAASDLAILTDVLGEEITFAGHTVSTAENGPFNLCSVTTTVTDGTLTLGIKTNGSDSQFGFEFPLLTDGDGWGWFKMDNFTLTYEGSGVGIENINIQESLNISVQNGFVAIEGVEQFKVYTLSGMEVSKETQLAPGIYIVQANGQAAKVFVQNY